MIKRMIVFFIYKKYKKLKKYHYKIGQVALKFRYMINIYQTNSSMI